MIKVKITKGFWESG